MGETVPPIDCTWWHAFLLHLSLAAGERQCKSVWENCVRIPILECVAMSRSSLKSKSEVFGCFSSTISRLLPINLKKVNKLTTPGLKKKRLLISSQRFWNGCAHKQRDSVVTSGDLACHTEQYIISGGEKKVLPWKMLCCITVWHYLNIKSRRFYLAKRKAINWVANYSSCEYFWYDGKFWRGQKRGFSCCSWPMPR